MPSTDTDTIWTQWLMRMIKEGSLWSLTSWTASRKVTNNCPISHQILSSDSTAEHSKEQHGLLKEFSLLMQHLIYTDITLYLLPKIHNSGQPIVVESIGTLPENTISATMDVQDQHPLKGQTVRNQEHNLRWGYSISCHQTLLCCHQPLLQLWWWHTHTHTHTHTHREREREREE